MIDLEITKRCAEAMGYAFEDSIGDLARVRFEYRSFTYRPLHDDAQAMALVKKFLLHPVHGMDDDMQWEVYGRGGGYGKSADLNRAICECVAKLKQGEGA